MEARSGKEGNPVQGGETAIIGDQTVLLNNNQQPLIFAWLVDLARESVARIHRDVFTIGSSPGADLPLTLPDVKGIHCSIYFSDNRFELNDNNSRSGTLVNHRPAKRQPLEDNDVIAIAGSQFLFKCFHGERNG